MGDAEHETELLSALRKLDEQQREQQRADSLRKERWRQAEEIGLRWGRTAGEVFGVMSLVGPEVMDRVCAVGEDWLCPGLVDALRIYLAIQRAQGLDEAA